MAKSQEEDEESSREAFYGHNTLAQRTCSRNWPICMYDFTFK